MKSLKNLKAVLIGFTLLLAVTIVYASANTLAIVGTVTITDVRVQFTAATVDVFSKGTAQVNTPGNAIEFDIELDEDHPTFKGTFKIKNTGKLDAEITVFNIMPDAGILVSLIPLAGGTEVGPIQSILEAGDVPIDFGVEWEYEINVSLDASWSGAGSKDEFEFIIDMAFGKA